MCFVAEDGNRRGGAFALTAGIAAFSPRFAFPAWLATMPDEAVRKCLDFMVDMAVVLTGRAANRMFGCEMRL